MSRSLLFACRCMGSTVMATCRCLLLCVDVSGVLCLDVYIDLHHLSLPPSLHTQPTLPHAHRMMRINWTHSSRKWQRQRHRQTLHNHLQNPQTKVTATKMITCYPVREEKQVSLVSEVKAIVGDASISVCVLCHI